MTKGGLIAKKKEMTKLRHENKYMPVTILTIPQQELVRMKSEEKDGYNAVVVAVGKKELKKDKGNKVAYDFMCEFSADDVSEGWTPTFDMLSDVASVRVIGTSKGKGFQGVMKRHNFSGGPATHGSKFHRAGGSTGTRKPRRTIKGRKMAGRMGGDRITLRSIPVIDTWVDGEDHIVAVKGSIPGAYNSWVRLCLV